MPDEKIKEIVEKYCLNVFRPIPDSLNISAEKALQEYGNYIRQQTLEEESRINHEIQKFIDGFGHPKDCVLCLQALKDKN